MRLMMKQTRTHQLNIRVEPAILEAVRVAAEKAQRSVSDWSRLALMEAATEETEATGA